MIYTTKELLNNGETEYSLRKRLIEGNLFLIERGFYSDSSDEKPSNICFACKKYPYAILTGLSAFYIYGFTDYIPDVVYLATEQHSFPIRRDGIKQSYQDPSFFSVGVAEKLTEEGNVKTYDLERLLIELFRLKEKYPRELFYEVLNSFRKNKKQLDFYKLNQYLKSFSNGSNLLLKIKESL